MDLSAVKKVYCIGIGGIGVSAVARWARHEEKEVSGSDLVESTLTQMLQKEGIEVVIGHDTKNVPDDADLVVYTPAADKDHVEREAAKKKKIPQISYPEFLGLLSETKFTIAVTGTHGKSTTTALIGLMLQEAGFDPTVFVGSLVPQLEHGNVRVGHSNFLVVEACEHQGNMRLINPNIAVVTSVEPDHLDFYQDLNHEITAYQEFVDRLPDDGLLVTYAEDSGCQKLRYKGKHVTYGYENTADVYYSGYEYKGGLSQFHTHFSVQGHPQTYEQKLGVPGAFNILNGLAAGIAAYEVGVPGSVVSHAAETFRGIWRRFEKVGEYNEAIIYSDYGHHPTEVRETMKMVRELYPDHRVVLVYQPHQHNRTKNLFKEFVDVLSVARMDVLVMNGIYDVAGREEDEDQDVSALKLLGEINKRISPPHHGFETHYTATLDETEEWVRENTKKDDVVVIMGAGDIDDVARRLIKKET